MKVEIERTNKKWKMWKLIGALLMLISLFSGSFGTGVVIFFIGVFCSSIGAAGAWWSNG